ncbi:hypothetical protein IKF04_04375 [Candidatus Saccharibacteria bacterium]|nr:hypothetical protein [Candidatus Saccharibacteria bacterium]
MNKEKITREYCDPLRDARNQTEMSQRKSRVPYNPDPMRPKNSVNASSLTPGCSPYGCYFGS